MSTERRHLRRLHLNRTHHPAELHSRKPEGRRSRGRLAVGGALAAVGMSIVLLYSADSPQPDRSAEPALPTTPVTLVNPHELFVYIPPNARNPELAGLHKLAPEGVTDLMEKEGFDPQNARIVQGETNIGPLRGPRAKEDPNGTEPYLTVVLPDGSKVYTPSSNIHKDEGTSQPPVSA